VIVAAVRWYRWVQRFTPLLVEAARPCRHAVGDRWLVDATYVKIGGLWRYVYRAVDQYGQVVDVYVSRRRNTEAARCFFDRALVDHARPAEVVTDKAQALPAAVDDVLPDALPITDRWCKNRIEAGHGLLKARLKPMRSLKRDRTAADVIRGHAFVQKVRRGHYELGVDARCDQLRLTAAFDELADII
jgi:transposase-like protein